MTSAEKYESVKGKIPTPADLSLWTPGKYITFIRFCEFFIVDGKLSVTKERWRKSEETLTMPNHPFHEYLYRINFFTFDKDASEKRFYFKLVNTIKVVLGYIQANPSMVTDDLKKVLENNAKFRWALQQTKVVETAIGVPVVVPQEGLVDQGSKTTVVPTSFDHQIQESAIKVVNLLDRLAKSVTQKEINDMPVKERLMAIGRLSFVFGLSKSVKPNKQIFQQINIKGADRETLESTLLSLNKHE